MSTKQLKFILIPITQYWCVVTRTKNFARFQEHIAHALNERIAQFVDAPENRPAVNRSPKLALCKFIVKTSGVSR